MCIIHVSRSVTCSVGNRHASEVRNERKKSSGVKPTPLVDEYRGGGGGGGYGDWGAVAPMPLPVFSELDNFCACERLTCSVEGQIALGGKFQSAHFHARRCVAR